MPNAIVATHAHFAFGQSSCASRRAFPSCQRGRKPRKVRFVGSSLFRLFKASAIFAVVSRGNERAVIVLPNVCATRLANFSSSANSPFALTSNVMFARLNEETNFLAVFVFKSSTNRLWLCPSRWRLTINGTLGKYFQFAQLFIIWTEVVFGMTRSELHHESRQFTLLE